MHAETFEPPGGGPAGEFFVVRAPDWINVVTLTADGRVVLIRQYRFGVAGATWEIPGGMCDPGEAPEAAAARELREETGYVARQIVPLGFVHPNPAIQSNRCHTFLAVDARCVVPPAPDEHEAIEVATVERSEVRAMIRDGRITHALVVAAFHLLDLAEEVGAP